LKILHIYSSRSKGGAEKVMLDLALSLERKGLKNIVASPTGSYIESKAKEMGLGTRTLRINGSFDPFGIIGLWQIVVRENVDVLHAHQGKVFWPCIFVKFLTGRKVVFHRHAQLAHRPYSRGHYSLADATIAISEAVKNGLVEREKVSSSRIHTVYNGIDFNRFSEINFGQNVKKEFGLEGKRVIGTVAAMNRPKGKGQRYLLEAAAILKSKYPNARYLVVGSGEILEDLRSTAASLGVSGEVVFAGYRENVEDFIAAMDVFCLLSWDTEGFGQVVVEAEAMGKPVIATKVGGIPETFEDNKTGLLIEPENSKQLAEKIDYFLSNEAKMTEFGRNASIFAKSKFSIDRMADEIINIYKGLGKVEHA